jgi:hypothetical protein
LDINQTEKQYMKKRSLFIYTAVCASIFLTSCIKQLEKEYTRAPVAEIDATVLNSKTSGLNYPVITRMPPMGRSITAGCPDSVLRRFSGEVRVRINLVGKQSAKDETVGFTTFDAPVTTFTFPATIAANAGLGCATAQTPSRAAASLAVSTALLGTHYNITNTGNKITIPANSSFGYLTINLLNPGVSTGSRFIGIKLDSTGTILPSFNYRELGIIVDQR